MKHHHLKKESNLNMKDITDLEYNHGEKVCKDFEIKNLDKYQ